MASVSGIDDFLYEPTRPPKSCRYWHLRWNAKPNLAIPKHSARTEQTEEPISRNWGWSRRWHLTIVPSWCASDSKLGKDSKPNANRGEDEGCEGGIGSLVASGHRVDIVGDNTGGNEWGWHGGLSLLDEGAWMRAFTVEGCRRTWEDVEKANQRVVIYTWPPVPYLIGLSEVWII